MSHSAMSHRMSHYDMFSHMYMPALVCTAVALYFGGKTLQPQVVWHHANLPVKTLEQKVRFVAGSSFKLGKY